jgi:hypothetical protein
MKLLRISSVGFDEQINYCSDFLLASDSEEKMRVL